MTLLVAGSASTGGLTALVAKKFRRKRDANAIIPTMSTQATTSEYMLLFLGTHWDKSLSLEEFQNVMSQWSDWFDRLVKQGKIKSANPLMDEGKIVTWKESQTVADGPFAESKEAIGGYFLLQTSDLDEALQIAKECPTLKHGLTVEVRPVADQFPHFQRAKRRLAHATP